MAARNAPEGNQGTPQTTADQDQGTQTRQLGQGDEQARLADNIPSDQTVPEQVYSDYAQNYDEDDAALNPTIPDVLVDAPVVSLKGLDLEVDELRAHVSLFSKVLDLVELSVGIDAYLGRVKLTIESIDVQALVKVRLDNVTAILDRVLTTIDRNPQIIQELTRSVGSAVENVGEGSNRAVSDLSSGAGSAVQDVGEGAGGAVEDVGEGAESTLQDVGEGAGSAVEDVGGGASQAVGDVGQAAEQVGEGAGQATQEAGQAARGVGDSVGQVAQGATGAAGQAGDATEQATGGGQEDPGQTDEAGEVRATPAAERKAEELGVDLTQVEGTGAGGRITLKDVTTAASGG